MPPQEPRSSYVGNTYDFKVVKINQERQNIVLSRRELIEQERTERRAKLLTEMMPGDIRKGTVKNITDFGAFIDLNGIDGLLHITDMSWGRIGHPSEMLKVGQDIDVVVLDINREKERVSLGPQAEAGQSVGQHRDEIPRRQPRSKARSSTSSLTARSSNWSRASKAWCTSPNFPGPSASPSPPTCSSRTRKSRPSCSASTATSRKSPSASANWKPIRGTRRQEKYPPGTHVKGKIRNLTSYGAFIELEEGSGRHDPRLRHLLDAQDQSSLRSAQEGRRSRGRRARSGQGQPAHRGRRQTALA